MKRCVMIVERPCVAASQHYGGGYGWLHYSVSERWTLKPALGSALGGVGRDQRPPSERMRGNGRPSLTASA